MISNFQVLSGNGNVNYKYEKKEYYFTILCEYLKVFHDSSNDVVKGMQYLFSIDCNPLNDQIFDNCGHKCLFVQC